MSKQLLVVLGMHRSGTSALTRGLQVLGVELGERLMPPKEGNNAKGFWEDVDVNQLNIELLDALECTWDTLSPVAEEQCLNEVALSFLPRAMALLQEKMAGCEWFGLKDPRVSVLLPFWQRVFAELKLNVRYVIALRNPLSVADSLRRRDGFAAEKSYYLWLQYMLACLRYTHKQPRLVVDFDRLMTSPAAQLERVAALLEQPFHERSQAFEQYSRDFLDNSLRHAVFDAGNMQAESALDDAARELYGVLLQLAEGEPDNAHLQRALTRIAKRLASLRPALDYMSECDGQISRLQHRLQQNDHRIEQLQQERDHWQRHAAHAEQQAEHFEQNVNLLRENVQGLLGRQQQLEQEVGQQARLLADSEQGRQRLEAELQQSRQHYEAELQQSREQLQQVLLSSSWRLTRPLRYGAGQLRMVHARSRKLVQLAQRAAPHIRREGGVLPLVKKVRRVLAAEGIQGLRARAQQAGASLPTLPAAGGAAFRASAEGHYALHSDAGGYCYVPPAPPLQLQAELDALQQKPLFSIVVPVYNTPPDLLSKLLASVQAQWYSNWELILADDCSPSEQTRQDLAAIDDPRVLVFCLPENRGIAGATNAAIEKAKGEFVVLLDHDDELTPDCLYELALCINAEDPDYIYSDEDKIDANGCYTEPHFKPDWSPDTMMSTMFVCHVSCIRRTLLEQVGGLRSEYDGCQDWDLILRVTESTSRIAHIPKVLYHWRIIPGSVAADIDAKPYVKDASKRVREHALERRGLNGTVEPVAEVPGYFRVNYAVQGEPLISIIIPSRDNHLVLKQCLDSILEKTRYRHFEIIVLDNGSVNAGTRAYLNEIEQHHQVSVIGHDAPFNFSELNNLGVAAAKGELLLFLNDDTEVISGDWLERMAGYAQLPHVGAVGARLLYPQTGTIQHAGVVNLELGPHHAFLHHDPAAPAYFMRNLLEYNWLAVTGACLMVERAKFERVGGFDELFPVAYNDVDLCFSLHAAGYYQVNCQAAVLLHHESLSRGHDHLDEQKRQRLEREKQRLFIKHPQYFQHDPFHNPNLHPNSINFELAV